MNVRLNVGEVGNLQAAIATAYAEGAEDISLHGEYRARTPGEYILRIDRSLSGLRLMGNAVLDGRYHTSHVIIVDDAEVSFDGLTIRGGDTQEARRVARYYNGPPGRSLYESIDGPGLLILGGGQVAISNCHIKDNHSGMCGGGLSNQGTGLVRVSNCCFSENSAFHTGGAIDNLTPGADIMIDLCRFSKNRSNVGSPAGGPHGQVTIFGRTRAAIRGCTFTGKDFPIDVREDTDITAENITWDSRLTPLYAPGGRHGFGVDAAHVARLATFALCHARHRLRPRVRAV